MQLPEVERTMNPNVGLTTLLGRIFLVVLYLISGFGKIMEPVTTKGAIASTGLPMVPVLYVLAIIFELVGGLSILFGIKARWGATMLIIFTVAASVLFHNFWASPPAEMQMQLINFLKNFSIIGGLLLLIAFGPGPISFDARRNVPRLSS
jgi:putative oxidoreductase